MALAFRAANTALATQSQINEEFVLPSIFDVLSEQSLNSSLRPGLKHLIQILSIWHPQKFKVIKKFYDEFYSIIMFLIENHFLKQYSASFSENFYGLKRVLLSNPKKKIFKNFSERLKSLTFLIFMPYISNKIEKFVKKLETSYAYQQTKLSKLFLFLYPFAKFGIMAICFAFQVLYVLRYLDKYGILTPSPFLYLANVYLVRLTSKDIKDFESKSLGLTKGSLFNKIWRFPFLLLSIVGRLLSYGIFFFQFFEYFYANDFTKQFFDINEFGHFLKPITPPHPLNTKLSENYVLKMEPNKCPLCLKIRTNDTVLSVSGYVFCYSCIYNYLQHQNQCPITSIPASVNQLIKIYKT